MWLLVTWLFIKNHLANCIWLANNTMMILPCDFWLHVFSLKTIWLAAFAYLTILQWFCHVTISYMSFCRKPFCQHTFCRQIFDQQLISCHTFSQKKRHLGRQTFGCQTFGQQTFGRQTFVWQTFGRQTFSWRKFGWHTFDYYHFCSTQVLPFGQHSIGRPNVFRLNVFGPKDVEQIM